MVSGLSDSRLADKGATRPVSAWREVEVLLLLLLVASLYFSRLTDLTIRGEESRWARVAHEMVESGDWIVPRQQGEPFPDRPPLNSWSMILAAKLTGQLNLVAIRLPTVMATLLSTLLIYIYGRNFLSRMGSFAAALAYCYHGASHATRTRGGKRCAADVVRGGGAAFMALCLCLRFRRREISGIARGIEQGVRSSGADITAGDPSLIRVHGNLRKGSAKGLGVLGFRLKDTFRGGS